jgi:hypothetical protein
MNTTENNTTEQTYEINTPEGPSFVRIVTQTSEQLAKSYERLKWIGFTSMAGVLIVITAFLLTFSPANKLPFESQLLFTITGFAMMLLSATLFAIQNVHSFRLENRKEDFALKSLEFKHADTRAAMDQSPAAPRADYKPPTG